MKVEGHVTHILIFLPPDISNPYYDNEGKPGYIEQVIPAGHAVRTFDDAKIRFTAA